MRPRSPAAPCGWVSAAFAALDGPASPRPAAAPPPAPPPAGPTRPAPGGRTRPTGPRRRRSPAAPAEGAALVRAALSRSPGVLVATAFHLALLGGLSLWTLSRALSEPETTFVVSLAPSREAVTLPPEAPPLEAGLSASAELGEGAGEVDLDRPFHESLGRANVGAAHTLGAGGGAGGGRGGASTLEGASGASDAALARALAWLDRHRDEGGAWGVLPQDHERTGGPPRRGEVAHTSLALLCFLCAGHGPDQEGPYRDLVRQAIAWLVARVGPAGEVSDSTGYVQGVALLALAEALGRRPEDAALRGAVERLVECARRHQDPEGGGWRYMPQQEGDTSVTCWVLLGLKSAEHAGVGVAPSTWADAARFLEQVSSARPGFTDYVPGHHEEVRLAAPGEAQRLHLRLGTHATGLFLRVLLGESPLSERNQAAAEVCMQIPDLVRAGMDRYAIYYTALAMYQVGGRAWRELNPTLRDGVVAAQHGDDGCEHGSWSDDQTWLARDMVLTTCFAALTLETYYRYVPVHGAVLPDRDDLTDGARRLLDAGALYAEAQRGGDPARLRAAEADLEEALAADEDAGSTEVLRLRRLALTELALARSDALVRGWRPGAAPEAERQARADAALGRAIDACAVEEAAVASPAARRAPREAAARLERIRRRLSLALSPARLDEARGRLERPEPTRAVTEDERGVVDALALRARHRFVDAARGKDPALFEEAEADAAWLEGRDLRRRLPKTDQAAWDALRAIAWPRVVALVRLGREPRALAALDELGARWPGERPAERRALERTLLLRQVQAGARPDARLLGILRAWASVAPADDPTPWTFVGQLLADANQLPEARLAAERALRGVLTDEERTRATLLQARLQRLAGELDAAAAALDDLERRGLGERVDVRLERCALLRAQGRGREAIGRYEAIVRALGVERPVAWWDAVEGMARAYLELKRHREGQQLLEGVVRRDRTFGGDAARADRFATLMVKLARW